MSRIPELIDDSVSSMYLWWRQMADLDLAFHPDDGAEEVVDPEGCRVFTDDEAKEVNRIVHGLDGMHATHGDEIYQAALQATEDGDITRVREEAIRNWASDDVQVSPYAEVEKVDGGYWVSVRLRVYEE